MYKNDDKKMQRSLTKNCTLFNRNLREFVRGQIPCQLMMHYPSIKKDVWLKSIANSAVIGLLRNLYELHGILPAPVLLILLKTHHRQMMSEKRRTLKKTSRERKADLVRISRAIRTVETYSEAFTGSSNLQREALNYLRSLQWQIKAIGRQKKPVEIDMRFCAQTLRGFFGAVAGRPLDDVIGSLMLTAFKWNRGAGDDDNLRLAALQRAKGPRINATPMIIQEARDLQNRDYSYWKDYLAEHGGEVALKAAAEGEKLFFNIMKKTSKQFSLKP